LHQTWNHRECGACARGMLKVEGTRIMVTIAVIYATKNLKGYSGPQHQDERDTSTH